MAIEIKDLTKRSVNYSQWYNDLVIKADLAEQSAVRGCMVIKPYGYAIWEKISTSLTRCSRLLEFRMHTFHYSYPSRSLVVRPST